MYLFICTLISSPMGNQSHLQYKRGNTIETNQIQWEWGLVSTELVISLQTTAFKLVPLVMPSSQIPLEQDQLAGSFPFPFLPTNTGITHTIVLDFLYITGKSGMGSPAWYLWASWCLLTFPGAHQVFLERRGVAQQGL